jgi:phosphoglycerate dehydrogenase-like enzyme
VSHRRARRNVGVVLTISVPTPDVLDHLGDLPDDVDVVVWDGLDDRPDGAERIRLFVGRYDAAPPAKETLAALPALEVVQLVSAGVEPWLPVVPDGALLCNGRGIHGGSTAELAVAGLLAIARDLPAYRDSQTHGRWERRQSAGVVGRRVLVLGAGDIGRRIGAAVEAFDAEVTYVARTARDGVRTLDELFRLLPEHEVVVIALPHTPETDALVDAQFLASMPDDAVLVNIARGSIVDTDALVGELQKERLHAFLDVTDPEPLPADHPLWTAPNVLITPHVGGGTRGWERRAYRLVYDQVLRFRAGKDLVNRVDRDRVGY